MKIMMDLNTTTAGDLTKLKGKEIILLGETKFDKTVEAIMNSMENVSSELFDSKEEIISFMQLQLLQGLDYVLTGDKTLARELNSNNVGTNVDLLLAYIARANNKSNLVLDAKPEVKRELNNVTAFINFNDKNSRDVIDPERRKMINDIKASLYAM